MSNQQHTPEMLLEVNAALISALEQIAADSTEARTCKVAFDALALAKQAMAPQKDRPCRRIPTGRHRQGKRRVTMKLVKTAPSERRYQLYTPDLPAAYQLIGDDGQTLATLDPFTGMSGAGWYVRVSGKSIGRFSKRKDAVAEARAAIAKARGAQA